MEDELTDEESAETLPGAMDAIEEARRRRVSRFERARRPRDVPTLGDLVWYRIPTH